MNNITPDVSPEQKRLAFNILAIIGFLGVIILIAWLAIQVVRVLPTAFSSLASIADSLYNNRTLPSTDNTFIIRSDRERVGTGEETTLTWDDIATPGSYTFSYGCVDGVTVAIRVNNENREIRCDTTYSLGDTTSAQVVASSTRNEEVAIPYTIAFLGTDDTDARSTAEGVLVVTGLNLAQAPTPTTEPTATSTAPNTTPSTPTTSAPTPTRAPTTVQWTTTSFVPPSDPNGYIDLGVGFLGIGTVNNNDVFTPSRVLSTTGRNAVQFEIRNYGTRTSEDWTFRVHLGGETVHRSGTQTPLKPNERAQFTLSFPADRNDEAGTLYVEVTAKNDRTDINNRFQVAIR